MEIFSGIFRHKVAAIIMLIIIAGGAYFIYANSKNKAPGTKYVLGTVEKGVLTASVSGSGNIAAEDSRDLNPEISGTIDQIKISAGDKVKKDQTLIIIKNDELALKADSAKASLNQAKENITKAKLDRAQKYQDYYDLVQKQKSNPSTVSGLDIKISAQKVRDAELSIKTAEIKANEAVFAYNQTKDDLGKLIIKSPIDGEITAINVNEGDSVNAASSGGQGEAAVTVVDFSKLSANVSLNEVDAVKIKKDQKATLTFDAVENLTVTGKAANIDKIGTVSQGVVSYAVKILLDNADERIRPGMTANAAIITDVRTDALFVPNGAVKSSNGSSYVEVPDETLLDNAAANSAAGIVLKNQPRRITVEVGISNDSSIEIISGLKEGDKVITQTITAANSLSVQSSQGGALRIPGLTGGGGAQRGAFFGR